MNFGSVCSGIEAASAAWLPLGWQCSFMSEIEAFPRAVLAHHYPETALHGDFTTIRAGDYGPVDVLVGGTPCQSFSVAGLRGGMADARGNLAIEYLRLAERLHPRWVVWENVPGVLSSGGGRDFGSFVGGLVELGYGFAYRVLDAQYFGLAQRRKRVFVVGCLGDWRRAAAVLFEPASLRGHPAPGREKRERVAASLTRGADSSGKGGYAGRRREDDENLVANPLGAKRDGGWRGDLDNDSYVLAETVRSHPRPGSNSVGNIAYGISPDCFDRSGEAATGTAGDRSGLGVDCEVAYAVRAKRPGGVAQIAPAISSNPYGDHESREGLLVAHSLRADGFDASEDGTGRGTPLVAIPLLEIGKGSSSRGVGPNGAGFGEDGDPMFTLQAGAQHGIAFQTSQSGVRGHDTHATLDANNGSRRHNGAIVGSAVRRLTPMECERLQGFEDNYTLIPWRNGMASDGPRYRALGNSMAVPCMSWIGKRLQMVAGN